MVRSSLLTKLLLAILLPTLLSFAGFAVLGHLAAARALEAELGRRLAGIAAVAATQISSESVALLSPGDEGSRTYRNLRRRLLEIRDAAGVARVYLFAADLSAQVDTDEVPIGTRLYGLETSRAELRQVFVSSDGRIASAAAPKPQAVSSVLFRGRDGQLYKSGFAPLLSVPTDSSQPPAVAFAVGVDGSAAIYADLLGLRKTLLWVGSGGAVAMVLLAILIGLGLTRPLRRLRESARLIGSGVLDRPVVVAATAAQADGDEVDELGKGLEAMRQALRARDERLQMMLSGIAHEVRNPLGGMELFAGLLAEELQALSTGTATSVADGPLLAGYVQRIQRELRHLQAVVSDFLDYARRPRPQLGAVAIAELLHEVADSVRASAPKSVNIDVELATPRLQVAADATQLRRALHNLAHNAVQACAALPESDPRPRRVELQAQATPSGDVRLRIRDTGPGIAEDILPKIWTPFFTTRAQGTGLGLAFVREIIEDHAGQLQLESSAAGTTFELTLPAAKAAG